MKYLKCVFVLNLVFFTLLLNETNAQKTSSEIRKELKQNEVMHVLNLWQLQELKGTQKERFTINAFEYKKSNDNKSLSGIQMNLFVETEIKLENVLKKEQKDYYSYIDETEFPKIMIAVNQMLKEVKSRLKAKKYGILQYKTIDNMTYGFIFTKHKKVAFLEFNNDADKCKFELPNPEKFFDIFYKNLDMANKKLYIPANLKKIKNAKKSNSKARDVNVDDI